MIILTRFLWLALGVLGLVAVGLGAYGAHAAGFDALALDRFETALLYHLVHLGGLAAALLLAKTGTARLALASALLFIAGTLLFSGSLYVNAFSGGAIPTGLAPLGGISFMAGWIALGIAGARTVRP